MTYKKLFEKGKIGNVFLKNRIVMTSVSVALAAKSGEVSDDLIAYYEERAKGGVGLIISGATAIDSETGIGGPHQPHLTDPSQVRPLERLALAIHKYDTKMFIQIYHRGKEARSSVLGGRQPVSASEVITRFGEKTHALTIEEIGKIKQNFINAAK